MAIRTVAAAVAAANKQKTNVKGLCQKTVRTWLNAPSVGDQDGDKDADAIDGWKSEPESARYTNRKPPKGAPGAFRNKAGNGFGHRTITIDDKGTQRSIDFSNGSYAPGVVGNGTIEQIEKALGLVWLGWSKTISGQKIPNLVVPGTPVKNPPKTPTKPPVKPKTSRGAYIDAAIKSVKRDRGKDPARAKLRDAALKALEKMPLVK